VNVGQVEVEQDQVDVVSESCMAVPAVPRCPARVKPCDALTYSAIAPQAISGSSSTTRTRIARVTMTTLFGGL